MAKNHGIEIDVSLDTGGLKKDFDNLEKKARSGAKSVVKTVNQIASAMSETGTEAKKAGQDYKESADGMEQAAKEAAEGTKNLEKALESTADSVSDLEKAERGLGEQTKETSKSQEQLGGKTEETRDEVEKSKSSFASWGTVAKGAVAGVVAVSGVLFAALGTGAGMAASFGTEYQQASNTIQASTGATKEEMAGLQEVMKNVYAGNFGEDMNDVAEAVANVKTYLGGTDQEIQKATEAAFAFRDTYGYDIPETTRAASILMKTFGTDAQQAYDLMAAGAQRGLDFSGEMLDSIDEYAPQFAKAGLSAEQMFNIMQAGYEEGAWNLDKIGDAVKELNIRLVDGSDTTAEGLKAIGMNADEVARKMSEGGEAATETYKQVVRSLAEMDDKQAQNIAGVNLFGTMWEDLGPDVVAQLAVVEGAYDNVQGTMEKINEVKYDDAGSALEALKRKAETSLLIPISENIMPAIQNATEAGIGYIDALASAYEDHGVTGLVAEAGEIFSDIAVAAAEKAPEMADAAVRFIGELVGGIAANRGRLAAAGIDLVSTLCTTVAQLLPPGLREPVEEAIDELSDSLSGGGIRNAIKTFSNIFEGGFKVVEKVTKTVLPPFVKVIDAVADNMDTLVPVVAAGAAAFKAYKVVDGVTKSMKASAAVLKVMIKAEKDHTTAQVAATAAAKLKALAVGVLTGKITLATAATTAWNTAMSANVLGVVIGGVSALAALLGASALASEDAAEATDELTEKQRESIEASKEKIAALEEEAEAHRKNIAVAAEEAGQSETLWQELQKCVDENGKIKAGYEERAQYITGELANALGIEIGIVDNQIDKYEELETSIYDVIAAKKAQAALDAMESHYTEAMQEQGEVAADLGEKYETLSATKAHLAELEAELTVEAGKAQKVTNYLGAEITRNTPRWSELNEEIRKTKGELEEQQAAFDETSAAMRDNEAIIKDYETLQEAIWSGNTDRINSALAEIQSGIDTTLEAGSEAALTQAQATGESLLNILALQDSGMYDLKQSTIDNTAEAMGISLNTISTSSDNMKKLLESVGTDGAVRMLMAFQQADMAGNLSLEAQSGMQAMISAVQGMEGPLSEESRTAMNTFLSEFDSLDEDTKTVWSQAWYGALSGLEGFESLADPAEQGADAFLESLRTILQVHSPSAAVRDIFAQVNPGAVEGVETGRGELIAAGQALVADFLNVLSSADLSGAGANFGQTYAAGILSSGPQGGGAGKSLAMTAKKAAASVKAADTGLQFGSDYASGIARAKATSTLAGKLVATSAKMAMALVRAEDTGRSFGGQYVSGVSEKTAEAGSAGHSLGSNANIGASSVSGYGAGRDFGAGYCNGISSMIGSAVRAAANLAMQSLLAAKRTIESNSPSKATGRLGRDFDLGYINEIVRNTSGAVRAAGQMGKKSVRALQSELEDVRLDFDVQASMARVMSALDSHQETFAAPVQEIVVKGAEARKRQLSKQELKAIGKAVGDVVNDRITNIKIVYRDRELGRIVREVQTV